MTETIRTRLIGLAAGLSLVLVAVGAQADDDAEAGHAIVAKNCASCHAVEASGDSPNPDAPPFRTFKAKWPLENLEEALAEGIVVGHDGVDMPEFTFEPDQISDIIAYLDQVGDS